MEPQVKQRYNKIAKKYNRSSSLYNMIGWPLEKLILEKWRKKVIPQLKGEILEIGVGTGKNLPYYNYKKVKLVGIDISKGMLSKAKEKVKMKNYPVKLILNESEELPFKDNSFDCIVTSCVLCSVPDQIEMLKEMKRVLKHKGKIFMLEHMLSKNKTLAFLEHIHNPIAQLLFGFNVNRPTLQNIKKSGFKIVKAKNYALHDIFKEIEVTK